MKKIFLLAVISVLFCHCSKFARNSEQEECLNVSKASETLGRAVASAIHDITVSLNKKGVDYSDADASEEFEVRYYEDISVYCGAITKGSDLSIYNDMSMSEFMSVYKSLTKKQLYYIERIINETSSCHSYTEMMDRLVRIADDIIIDVPEIQRERLQNIVAVLYYGAKELQYLLGNGLMISNPQSTVKRLKTKSEFDDVTCTRFLATVWTIAVGEPTIAGEIVASVATVYYAGKMLYEVVVCGKRYSDNREDCIERYTECKEQMPPIEHCDDCLQFCRFQYVWPNDMCFW